MEWKASELGRMIEGGFGSVKKKFKNTLNGVIDVESLMNLGHAFKNLDSYNGPNFIGSCDRIESKILVDRNLENGIDQVSAGFNVTLREVFDRRYRIKRIGLIINSKPGSISPLSLSDGN